MNNKLKQIEELIEKECNSLGFAPDWFFDDHLKKVEKNALWLLNKIKDVDREVVLLGVWLHDTQRVRGINIDHQKGGAQEAEKILKDFEYDRKTIKKVKKIILSHSCNDIMPDTLEGRILASADAMAHYNSDFFLRIALLGDMGLEEYREWTLEKLDRNYHQKITFDFAKKKIKKRHEIIKSFIENKS